MTLAYTLNTILYTVPCFVLLYLTFRKHIIPPAIPRLVASIVLFSIISVLGSYAFAVLITSSLSRTLFSVPLIFVGTAIFCGIADFTFWQGVFIVSAAKCYAENVRLISLFLYFTCAKRLPNISSLQFAGTTFIVTLFSFYAIYQFFKKLLLPALECTFALNTWQILWVVPICNTVIHTLLVSPNIANLSFFPGNEFYFIPPLWTLLTFSTNGILLRMIIDISQNARLKEALQLSETQITAQQKQLESLQSHMEQVRRMRHDSRHHVMALRGLLKNSRNEEIEAYLRELSDHIPSLPENYCDDPSVNALLCHYHSQAKDEGISVSFLISIPEDHPFSSTDLCIILGNFLENAIEACRRMKSSDKFISLKMTLHKRLTLVIMAENSYEGAVLRARDGSFLSSKEKNRKGLGISSVLHVTEKYNGIPRFEYQDNVFKAFLLLNAKEQP